jgi:hypothetical protein
MYSTVVGNRGEAAADTVFRGMLEASGRADYLYGSGLRA